jgi:hypothetical protein
MKSVSLEGGLHMKQERMFLKQVSKGLMILLFLFGIAVHPVYAEVIFNEDFESGWGDWWADNGVWEVGTPTAGPDSCHGGSQCAGTVLDGNYPQSTDSRMITPSIKLSNVSGDEELHLRFWQWFSYTSDDAGYVQISVYDEELEEWSDWVTISNSIINSSPSWSLMNVELTDYAGKKVRIAFYHTADFPYESTGWYIDDVQITKKLPEFTGDFEFGWGDWNADRGLWEVGTPTAGPENCHSGANCAGTVLDGNYPTSTDSRMITPSIKLPDVEGDEELHLRFWQWFSYTTDDAGYVQISVYDEGTWSDWQTISDPIDGSTPNWSLMNVELTDYAGKKVRIAFYHTADWPYESTGWYIDDVQITGIGWAVIPDVKANGHDGPLYITVDDSVEITVSLDSGDMSGENADWWIGALTPFGTYWLNPSLNWVKFDTPISVGQYPLFDLSETSLLNMSLPVGYYTFFFVLDDNPNGVFDDMTWYDYVVVGVSAETLMPIKENLPDFDDIFKKKMNELRNR